MDDKTDISALILRFIFGVLLGGLLTALAAITVIWLGEPKVIKVVLMIGGIITLVVAISAAIWGDRVLSGFMKIFKIFKHLL